MVTVYYSMVHNMLNNTTIVKIYSETILNIYADVTRKFTIISALNTIFLVGMSNSK